MTPKLLRSDNGTKNLRRNIFDETKIFCHFLVTLLFRIQDGVSETEKIMANGRVGTRVSSLRPQPRDSQRRCAPESASERN